MAEVPNIEEIATGRLYIGGEPEVRLRRKDVPPDAVGNLFLVVTEMGDESGPVGLTSSLFAAGASGIGSAAALAKEQIARRIASVGGQVLDQTVEQVHALPDDLTRFVVINLLRAAKALRPE